MFLDRIIVGLLAAALSLFPPLAFVHEAQALTAIERAVIQYQSPAPSAAITFTTFNPADLSQITLSGGNLIATGTGAGGVDGGVRSIASKSITNNYIEFTPSTSAGSDTGFGIVNGGTAFATYANDATGGANLYRSGNLWVNGSSVLVGATAAWTNGAPIGMAVNFSAKLIWFTMNGTTWSNSGNPTAGTGGISFSAVTGPFFFAFTNNNGNADAGTVNPGSSPFSFTPPSGFIAGY